MKAYPINEIFYSLQGEGYHTGTPALFIRFSGCNLDCPFCDTDFRAAELLSKEEIGERIRECIGGSRCIGESRNKSIGGSRDEDNFPHLVVLTGGEPTLFADGELCRWLRALFRTVAMETNGTRAVPEGVNWVTLSPKADFLGSQAGPVLRSCDEIKVVYDGHNDPFAWAERISATHHFVQSCDTGDPARNAILLSETIGLLKSHPAWRLSLQTHKIINVR